MDQIDTDLVPNFDPDQGPTCMACHDAAQGVLREVAGWDPNGNGTADQFDMCTSCHNLKDADGTLYGAGPTVPAGIGTKEFYHNTSWYRIIATTHYDNPATPTLVEGYNVRATGAQPCFDCHSHDLRTNTRRFNAVGATTDYGPTLFTDWAQSGHGGGLLDAKVAAALLPETGAEEVTQVMAAGSDGEVFAWGHYNWDDTTGPAGDGVNARGSCQKCHTATGFMNFANDPDNYVVANNDFSHLVVGRGRRFQSERTALLLGLPQRHRTGALRMQQASRRSSLTTASRWSFRTSASPTPVSFVTAVVATPMRATPRRGLPVTMPRRGHPLQHHISPWVTSMPPQLRQLRARPPDYQRPPPRPLRQLPHEWLRPHLRASLPVTSSRATSTGWVPRRPATAVMVAASPSPRWRSCRPGTSRPGQVLRDYVANTLPNYTGAPVNQDNTVTNDRGAFQNSKLATEELGAFTHNSQYAKRLIFDAIDWLDNGALNGTINIDADVYPLAAEWYGAMAPATGFYVAVRP